MNIIVTTIEKMDMLMNISMYGGAVVMLVKIMAFGHLIILMFITNVCRWAGS